MARINPEAEAIGRDAGEPVLDEGLQEEVAAAAARIDRRRIPYGGRQSDTTSADLPVVFITSEMIESAVADAGGFVRVSGGEPAQPPRKSRNLGGGATELDVEIGQECGFGTDATRSQTREDGWELIRTTPRTIAGSIGWRSRPQGQSAGPGLP